MRTPMTYLPSCAEYQDVAEFVVIDDSVSSDIIIEGELRRVCIFRVHAPDPSSISVDLDEAAKSREEGDVDSVGGLQSFPGILRRGTQRRELQTRQPSKVGFHRRLTVVGRIRVGTSVASGRCVWKVVAVLSMIERTVGVVIGEINTVRKIGERGRVKIQILSM